MIYHFVCLNINNVFLVLEMYKFGVVEEALTALPQLIQFLCSQAANLGQVLLDICFLETSSKCGLKKCTERI